MKNFSLSILLVGALVSCADIPTPFGKARIVGGKGGLYYNADGSMSYVFNHVQSFQHFMQMLGLAITQGLSALEHLADQTTSQMLAGEITKREAGERLALIEKVRIDAGVRGAEVFNPNIALPVRQ